MQINQLLLPWNKKSIYLEQNEYLFLNKKLNTIGNKK
jgi:hypothetical protein